MNTEQEAQQAKTIAEVIAIRMGGDYPREYYRESIDKILAIVDSKAQKIADLNRVGSNTLMALIESQEKVAEQAKEIERLKQRIQDEYDAKAGF